MQHASRPALFLSVLLLFSSASFGQRNPGPGNLRFEISGVVTDEADHSPIQGVEARLLTAAGEMITTSVSQSSGQFSFDNIRGGEYVVHFSVNGYEPQDAKVTLISMTENKLNISMRKTTGAKQDGGSTDNAVTSRELGLPPKAQDALAKGKDRLYQKHDPAGSLPFFQKVLDLSPGFYEARYLQGVAYTFLQKTPEAEDAFRKSIADSGDQYADPCFALASLLTDQKKFQDAEQLSREGLKAQPEAWRGYYELARAMLGEGHPAEAEKSGLEARKRKTDFPGLYLILTNIHLQLHNNEAVLEDVNDYLKLEPDGPFSGQARQIKEQVERALGHPPTPPQ